MNIREIIDLKTKEFVNSKYETIVEGNYSRYIHTVSDFSGNKKQLLVIISLYEKQLKQYILSNSFLKELILYDGKMYRHDLDFE